MKALVVLAVLFLSSCSNEAIPTSYWYQILNSNNLNENTTKETIENFVGRITDLNYNLNECIIQTQNTGKLQVSIDTARTCWIDVSEFDIQYLKYESNTIKIGDSKRWLHNWFYRITEETETTPYVLVTQTQSNDTIYKKIEIINIANLWCYQLKLAFNVEELQLISHTINNTNNVLTKNNGNVIGFSQYQLNPLDTSKICYAATITGTDSTQKVNGNGLIGEAIFKAKNKTNTIEIENVLIGCFDDSKELETIKIIKVY